MKTCRYFGMLGFQLSDASQGICEKCPASRRRGCQIETERRELRPITEVQEIRSEQEMNYRADVLPGWRRQPWQK